MATDSSSDAYLQRGLILSEQGRYTEAEDYFRKVLSIDPHHAFAFYQLAICQLNQPDKRKEALDSINSAIALEPQEPVFFSIKSFILQTLDRSNEAMEAALDAIRLDPTSCVAFTAKANTHLKMEEWAKAEEAARQALSHDPDSTMAANILIQALRLQNKLDQSNQQISGLLSRDPEDSATHESAGWVALQGGDHKKAETHFLEALRIDPEGTGARAGLIEAFKARSVFYRSYLKYCFFMQRMTRGTRLALIIGLWFGATYARSLFTGPNAWMGITIGLLYLLVVLWSHLATGTGNFFVLLDNFARHALTRPQKIEAFAVGGGVLAGLALLLIGILLRHIAFSLGGATLIGASIPFAHTFTNASRAGKYLFGFFGGFVLLAGLTTLLYPLSPAWVSLKLVQNIGSTALLFVVATTWLSLSRVLNR